MQPKFKIKLKKPLVPACKMDDITRVCGAQCIHCGQTFTRKDSYTRHINKSRCPSKKDEYEKLMFESISKQNKLMELMQKELKEIKEKQSEPIIQNINQNLYMKIVCIKENDNYLDMLTDEMGYDQALGFIRDCALSDIRGDCRLLQKLYLEVDPKAITYWGNKSNLSYLNENEERVIDHKGVQLSKKLVNNLKNSYLKGHSHYKKDPQKQMNEYDLEVWEKHIYDLNTSERGQKIIKNLPLQVSNPNKINSDGTMISSAQ